MKTMKTMKNYIKYLPILFVSLLLTSCLVDDEDPFEAFDEGPNLVGFTSATVNASVVADGFTSEILLPVTFAGPSASSVQSDFTANIAVDPASTAIEGVHYTLTSTTINMSADTNYIATFPITIITDGIVPPLDTNPILILNIVDISDGSIVPNGRTASIDVTIEYLCFSQITGKYRALFGEYYRIGEGPNCVAADWPAETEIIFLCGTTYRVLEWFGCFDGNEWYIDIAADGTISYPALTPDGDVQTGNGQPLITCQTNPADMTNVPCGPGSNMMTMDGDVITLNMSYGYFTAGSGSREFTHILEKIVD